MDLLAVGFDQEQLSTDCGSTWQSMPNTGRFTYVNVTVGLGQDTVLAFGQGTGTTDTSHASYLLRSTNGGATWDQMAPQIDGQTLSGCSTPPVPMADGTLGGWTGC